MFELWFVNTLRAWICLPLHRWLFYRVFLKLNECCACRETSTQQIVSYWAGLFPAFLVGALHLRYIRLSVYKRKTRKLFVYRGFRVLRRGAWRSQASCLILICTAKVRRFFCLCKFWRANFWKACVYRGFGGVAEAIKTLFLVIFSQICLSVDVKRRKAFALQLRYM